MLGGLLLAAFLIVLGVGTTARQWRTVRRLREEPFLPDGDRAYFRGQVQRRIAIGVVLTVIGGLIVFYYLSGMDARMDAIGEKAERAEAAGEPKPESTDEERRFAKRVGWYWIGVLGLVFVVGCLAVLDFWATRVYWLVRYREIKADHEAKLQRDLAVYRQQKLNDRMKGPRKGDSDTAENDPIE